MQARRITPTRLRARFRAIAFVASLFCVCVAHATAYFVATNGNDAANGLSTSTPFHTIAHAVNVVGPGDSIDVRAGTYVESVVISRSGTAAAWIVLRAYPGEAPLWRSTGSAPTLYFYHPDCDEDVIGSGSGNVDCHPLYWIVQGLTMQGSPTGGDDGYVVKIDTPQVRLQRNRLCCSKVDIVKLVRTANDVEIRDNEIWQDAGVVTPGANAQGIDIVGADRTHVIGNFVHDVPDIGIYAKGNSRNTFIECNLLMRIGGPDNGNALMLGQSTDADRLADGNYETYDGIVRNNVVVGSTYACLATSSSSNARFYNNSCHDTARTGQASIYLSNESEVGKTGSGLVFVNNVIDGNAARPVVKIGSDAMSDYSTLVFARNLFHVAAGAPQFYASDFFNPIGFAQWQSNFLQLTGHAETGLVADPLFLTTDGEMPLAIGANSPAVDAGDNAVAWVPDDYTGRPRPLGNAFDIGAYEFAGDTIFCDAFEGMTC
ncbi:MAG: right-handed parallel beta-helix repeat-containing protein [Dokdonella sp.]